MLLAIVVLFAICWSPRLIDNVLVEFGLLNRLHHGYLNITCNVIIIPELTFTTGT